MENRINKIIEEFREVIGLFPDGPESEQPCPSCSFEACAMCYDLTGEQCPYSDYYIVEG